MGLMVQKHLLLVDGNVQHDWSTWPC